MPMIRITAGGQTWVLKVYPGTMDLLSRCRCLHLYLSLACLNCRIILRAISLDIAVTPWRILKTQPRGNNTPQSIAARHNSTPSDAAADDWASDSTDDDDWDFDEDADKT